MLPDMDGSKITFPEVVGKSIANLSVYDDPQYGREMLLQFSDGTQLSICVAVKQTMDARYSKDDTPDTPIFIRND